jgi:hypothetical protein
MTAPGGPVLGASGRVTGWLVARFASFIALLPPALAEFFARFGICRSDVACRGGSGLTAGGSEGV